ncbi:MAG TPA: (Fe-S)-binding protein [Candidatus Tumulicola sp.]|nr:(Fe-S)-binding protein [Candidatus Tumulicola sp.]
MLAGFSPHDAPSDAIVNTCIRCGFCLPTCPTYVLTQDERSSPRGRIGLIGEVIEGRLGVDDATFRAQMFECLGCRNCEPVCPSGVAFGALLEDARAQITQADASSPAGRLRALAYDVLLGNLSTLRLLAILARWYRITGFQRIVRRSGLLEVLGIERLERLMPAIENTPFDADGSTWLPSAGRPKGKVALFCGCVMSVAFANVHKATVRVLNVNGWAVEATRDQGCCGALHVHAGFKDRARELARKTIAAFERSSAQFIVVNAAGCGAQLKEYGHLLKDDPSWAHRAQTFSERVRDFSELLASEPLNCEDMEGVRARVTYQDACHLAHAQRITREPRTLIDAIPGVERIEMPESDRCCGSAGVYNITHPAFAALLGERKLAAAASVGAERIVTTNPGCQMQLEAEAARIGGLRVQHIAQLLDESYGVAGVTPDATDGARRPSSGGLHVTLGAIAAVGVAALLVRSLLRSK